MGEMKICDLCQQDGEETKAVGWYTANDGDDYDVCRKHAKAAKGMGFEVELHEGEEE